MTSLQYYCILRLAEIKKNCIPETKLCAEDAGCAGNKITEAGCFAIAFLTDVLLL